AREAAGLHRQECQAHEAAPGSTVGFNGRVGRFRLKAQRREGFDCRDRQTGGLKTPLSVISSFRQKPESQAIARDPRLSRTYVTNSSLAPDKTAKYIIKYQYFY